MWQQYRQEKDNIHLSDAFKENLIETMNQAETKTKYYSRRRAIAIALSLAGIILILLGFLELNEPEQPIQPCIVLTPKSRVEHQTNDPFHLTNAQLLQLNFHGFTLTHSTSTSENPPTYSHTFTRDQQQIQITLTYTPEISLLPHDPPTRLHSSQQNHIALFAREDLLFQLVFQNIPQEEAATYFYELRQLLGEDD